MMSLGDYINASPTMSSDDEFIQSMPLFGFHDQTEIDQDLLDMSDIPMLHPLSTQSTPIIDEYFPTCHTDQCSGYWPSTGTSHGLCMDPLTPQTPEHLLYHESLPVEVLRDQRTFQSWSEGSFPGMDLSYDLNAVTESPTVGQYAFGSESMDGIQYWDSSTLASPVNAPLAAEYFPPTQPTLENFQNKYDVKAIAHLEGCMMHHPMAINMVAANVITSAPFMQDIDDFASPNNCSLDNPNRIGSQGHIENHGILF